MVGIAGAGSLKEVGRIGLKAIVYFEIVTTMALFIGLAAVNLTRPGDGVNLPSEPSAEAKEIASRAAKISPQDHIVGIFPTSIVRSMAENDVLQIVVFSLLFAAAVAALGEKGKPVLQLCESVSEVMFKFTNYVMHFAPWGVGAAMAVTVGKNGPEVLKNLAMLIGTLYAALSSSSSSCSARWRRSSACRCGASSRSSKSRCILAFTTTSSESAFPKALENMEKLGVPKRIVSFVLPMGYSFNLDGSTLYLSLAAMFVAQASNHELGIGEQLLMVLTLMLTTKGIAAVPRASLVVLSGTLASVRASARGHRRHPRRRRAHGHGAHGDQRARQLPGDRRRGEVGRAVSAAGLERVRRGNVGRAGRSGKPRGVTRLPIPQGGGVKIMLHGARDSSCLVTALSSSARVLTPAGTGLQPATLQAVPTSMMAPAIWMRST